MCLSHERLKLYYYFQNKDSVLERTTATKQTKNLQPFLCTTFPDSAALLENSKISLKQVELKDYLQACDTHRLRAFNLHFEL